MEDRIILVEDVDRDAEKRWRIFYWIIFLVSTGAILLGVKIWYNLKDNAINNFYPAQFQSYNYGYQQLAYPAAGGGGCCGGSGSAVVSGGGCGSGGCGGGGTQLGAADLEKIKQQALSFYRQQTGDNSQVDARVQDFGCHIQVDIFKNGAKIKSYAWRGGQVSEIQ